MSINGIEPKVTAKVIVEDFHEQLRDIQLRDSNISTGRSVMELYTHDQVINLLLKFGLEVNDSASQNGWGWCPVKESMIERFVDGL